jgi:hypothetical protein
MMGIEKDVEKKKDEIVMKEKKIDEKCDEKENKKKVIGDDKK